METVIFLMGVFGVISLLMELGMQGQNRTKRNRERNTVFIIGMVFCCLWLITGVVVILMKHYNY